MSVRASLERLRVGAAFLAQRELALGFGAWVEMAAEHAAFMQALRKGLSFFVNRRCALAFGGWQHGVSLTHSASVKKAAMTRALMYLTHRNLARGWGGWSGCGGCHAAPLAGGARSGGGGARAAGAPAGWYAHCCDGCAAARAP